VTAQGPVQSERAISLAREAYALVRADPARVQALLSEIARLVDDPEHPRNVVPLRRLRRCLSAKPSRLCTMRSVASTSRRVNAGFRRARRP
jgi:hypothetical protein